MDTDRIAGLIHLYEDGALNRRDVIRKLVGCTGSMAAAMAVLDPRGWRRPRPLRAQARSG